MAISLALLTAPSRGQAPADLGCGLEPGPERAVAAVVDGETVRLDDGKEVRLAGALSPRARDVGARGGAWPPEAATLAALVGLIEGRTVALAFAGRREDRHGRVLAQLFIWQQGAAVWVQGWLVQNGLARAYGMPGNDACMTPLLEREGQARAASLGLWAHAAYQVRPADRPAELAHYQGTYQLVSGRIERSAGSATLVRLDLASPTKPRLSLQEVERRRNVRIIWRRNVLALGDRAAELKGRDVLVRGWIDVRGGAPEIEILAAGQLEAGLPAGRHRRRKPGGAGNEARRPADPPGATPER